MDGGVAVFLWMMIALKIPIAMLLWLVWYAARAPEPDGADEDRGGGNDRQDPRDPRWPKPRGRGPHSDPRPPAPQRTRIARGKTLREPRRTP